MPTNETDKKETAYFKSLKHAGLSIVVYEGEELKKSAKFTQYYDTFKGDVIRVGFLKTDDAQIIERCRADLLVDEIEKKEFEDSTEGDKALRRAPVPAS